MNEDRKKIRCYLRRYGSCINRKRELEIRLKTIKAEMEYPLSAVAYDNTIKTFCVSAGAAAYTYRIAEIEDKIDRQKNKAIKELFKIMEILDFLPDESVEREILEKRFIDRKSWFRVTNSMHISRSQAALYEKNALDKLMSYKRVRELVNEFWNKRFEIN